MIWLLHDIFEICLKSLRIEYRKFTEEIILFSYILYIIVQKISKHNFPLFSNNSL